MGTEISVASTVYNLAGDETERPQYLKTLVVQSMFSKNSEGTSQSVLQGLLQGPAMKLRSFYRWALIASHYDQIGLPTGNLQVSSQPSTATVEAAIPHDVGESVSATLVTIAQGDSVYWAERWILDNRASDFSSAWTYQIDDTGAYITIVFPTGSPDPLIEVVPASSPTFNPTTWYVFANYTLTTPGTVTDEDPTPADIVTQRRFIYAKGSGNATLDALVSSATSYGQFFPFIPVRLSNKFLSTTNLSSAYAQAKKAYKKALNGADFDDLVSKIALNPDLSKIDHAYVVFGVSLNVKENECRKYLYNFFKSLQSIQTGGATTTQTAKANLVTIAGSTTVAASYNMRLEWRYINETAGSGLGKVGAQVGDLWFVKNGKISSKYEDLRLYWQHSATSYTYLDIVGMIHRNYVYKTSNVGIAAFAAIDDTKESGFIIPLHYDIWRRTSLVVTSQMATACVFMVFNCYQTYKVESNWWDSWIFKILLVVVIAVVSVVFTGGAGLGLLGAPLAIGTSLGFTGLTATIVGAVANALAAMILISLIEPLVQKAAGPYAPIVMAVLMFAIGQASGAFQAGGTFAVNWGDLLRVDNLLAMTNAVGQTVSNQVNADTHSLQQQTLDYVQKAEAETQKIQQAFFEKFGYGGGTIDPLLFTDSFNKALVAESSDTFLTRTLMTGSEIAEMSRQLLYEFPTYSLTLPDAFT